MGTRMELVAGDVSEIVGIIESDDRAALAHPKRVAAYLSLSGGMDPTWLDLFAESARIATDRDAPTDFIDARIEMGVAGGSNGSERTVERVDPAWISAVAAIPDNALGALAGRWIDRLEDEFGSMARDEKPWIRELAGRVVAFCRTADQGADVVFVWEL
jgi:hypothetical protein